MHTSYKQKFEELEPTIPDDLIRELFKIYLIWECDENGYRSLIGKYKELEHFKRLPLSDAVTEYKVVNKNE